MPPVDGTMPPEVTVGVGVADGAVVAAGAVVAVGEGVSPPVPGIEPLEVVWVGLGGDLAVLQQQVETLEHTIEALQQRKARLERKLARKFISDEEIASMKNEETDPEIAKLGTCMVKTHLSLTDNPSIKGVPKGWRLRIRDILTYKGAGFVVPVAGTITLMPGTSSDPAYRRVDVDVETGKVKGVF